VIGACSMRDRRSPAGDRLAAGGAAAAAPHGSVGKRQLLGAASHLIWATKFSAPAFVGCVRNVS
jgi:hypothetical protein